MLADHVGDLLVAGQGELERDAKAMGPCVPGPQSSQSRGRLAQAVGLVVVLVGLQPDVVAEPLRLLMSVGMAPDADQQRGVIHIRSTLVVEPDPLGQSQRDQALPQDVFHRLPEAEIYSERRRGDEFRQPDVRTIGPLGHRPRLADPPSAEDEANASCARFVPRLLSCRSMKPATRMERTCQPDPRYRRLGPHVGVPGAGARSRPRLHRAAPQAVAQRESEAFRGSRHRRGIRRRDGGNLDHRASGNEAATTGPSPERSERR
jgi:hypothetical protein